MTIETLKSRIENANNKIEKKQETISKKTALIAKKSKSINYDLSDIKNAMQEAREDGDMNSLWTICDIEYLQDDIGRLNKEIAEIKANLKKYEEELEVETQKANSRNIPVIIEFLENWKHRVFEAYDSLFKDYYEEKDRLSMLVANRNKYEMFSQEYEEASKIYKEEHKKFYQKLHGYKEIDKKTGIQKKIEDGEWESIVPYVIGNVYAVAVDKLNKELEVEASHKYDFIIERTNKIVGTITDASDLRIGAKGDLNGYIVGTDGVANVHTIGAGGYNIQCFHFRTLIKAIN